MFNIEETFLIKRDYSVQTARPATAVSCVGIAFAGVDLARNQVSEIDLIQLIPGFYFLLLFGTYLLFFVISGRFFARAKIRDARQKTGTKTTTRLQLRIRKKERIQLFSCIFVLILNTVVPISFDCFNDYSIRTVESSWSLNEVLSLEATLLAILGVLSQSPVEISRGILGEKKIQALPKSWRQIVFFLILSAGSLTPTIDGNTQLSFAGCTISLFGVLINLVQKRNDSQEKIIYGS